MDDLIGPSLPPGMLSKSSNDNNDTLGPSLQPTAQPTDTIISNTRSAVAQEQDTTIRSQTLPNESQPIGPSLPQSLSESSASIGPQLPPPVENLADNSKEELFGPVLPPGFNESKVVGPQLPPGFKTQVSDDEEDDDDDQVIGPLPPSLNEQEENKCGIAREFENRSRRMKDRLEGREAPKKLEREEWMTELPPVLQGFGMGPRQFRARPTDIGDRSGWTDTPSDKLKKSKEKKVSQKEPANLHVIERDAEIAKQIANYEEPDRQESLLSMHEKKRKRKLKEECDSGEANIRRPFDRDLDLQANRFDDAAKKRIMKKSAGLASRFSHGETSGTFL